MGDGETGCPGHSSADRVDRRARVDCRIGVNTTCFDGTTDLPRLVVRHGSACQNDVGCAGPPAWELSASCGASVAAHASFPARRGAELR